MRQICSDLRLDSELTDEEEGFTSEVTDTEIPVPPKLEELWHTGADHEAVETDSAVRSSEYSVIDPGRFVNASDWEEEAETTEIFKRTGVSSLSRALDSTASSRRRYEDHLSAAFHSLPMRGLVMPWENPLISGSLVHMFGSKSNSIFRPTPTPFPVRQAEPASSKAVINAAAFSQRVARIRRIEVPCTLR